MTSKEIIKKASSIKLNDKYGNIYYIAINKPWEEKKTEFQYLFKAEHSFEATAIEILDNNIKLIYKSKFNLKILNQQIVTVYLKKDFVKKLVY